MTYKESHIFLSESEQLISLELKNVCLLFFILKDLSWVQISADVLWPKNIYFIKVNKFDLRDNTPSKGWKIKAKVKSLLFTLLQLLICLGILNNEKNLFIELQNMLSGKEPTRIIEPKSGLYTGLLKIKLYVSEGIIQIPLEL